MSQRSLKSYLALTGLLLALILVFSASSVAANPVVELVTGSSHMTIPLSEFNPDLEGDAEMRTLSYNARRHADDSVNGQYQYHQVVQGNSTTLHGTVICFKVEGNRAWIGATIEQSSNPALVGLFAWWQVADNGQGANNPPDRSTFVGAGTLQETLDYCEGPAPNFIFDIQGGNIKVH